MGLGGLISIGLLAWAGCGGGGVGHRALLATARDTWGRLFQSQRRCDDAILEGIRGAKRTILVHAYLLYSTRLAGALVRAHQRGVRVHVILDAHAQPHHPPVPAVARLVAAGITVSLDARHESAHDKVMILDGEVVITGSYNWTVAAESITARISW